MRCTVFMLQEAEFDLEAIFQYLLDSGNPAAAKDMIRLIRNACDSSSQMPERGHVQDVSALDALTLLVEHQTRDLCPGSGPNRNTVTVATHGRRGIGDGLAAPGGRSRAAGSAHRQHHRLGERAPVVLLALEHDPQLRAGFHAGDHRLQLGGRLLGQRRESHVPPEPGPKQGKGHQCDCEHNDKRLEDAADD